jgi:hypothetical protein
MTPHADLGDPALRLVRSDREVIRGRCPFWIEWPTARTACGTNQDNVFALRLDGIKRFEDLKLVRFLADILRSLLGSNGRYTVRIVRRHLGVERRRDVRHATPGTSTPYVINNHQFLFLTRHLHDPQFNA